MEDNKLKGSGESKSATGSDNSGHGTPGSGQLPRLGMVGLGRMGSNLVRRYVGQGGLSVVCDTDPKPAEQLASELGDAVTAANDLAALVGKMASPRVIWVMVPAEVVGSVMNELGPLLDSGDVVIDGGNSDWRNDKARADQLAETGVMMLDVGTSGGVWGFERGYCMMVGGPPEAVALARPILDILSPAAEDVERTGGRSGPPTPAEQGWLHCGPSGAGHFVKMVHNGIEYGLMAAYAEGFNLLGHGDAYGFDLDLPEISEVWRRGSVIGSWLLDLTAAAYVKDSELTGFDGFVSDSGEGRWTLEAGIDLAVPMPVLSGALFSRFSSRGESANADKLLSAMRNEFGGHVEPDSKKAGQ